MLIDSTSVDKPGTVEAHLNPYEGMEPEPCEQAQAEPETETPIRLMASPKPIPMRSDFLRRGRRRGPRALRACFEGISQGDQSA
ncbi:MAG: hypothetical protein CM15mP74_10060 [Halieaceae bacterium]|nr:MAG: hypothetical protein CM15mP74_10060 [Halieaceae bacterium]